MSNANKTKHYDYLLNNGYIDKKNGKINIMIINDIAGLLSIFDYKMYLLNLFYKTCVRRKICEKFKIYPINILNYKSFLNEYLNANDIIDKNDNRLSIIRNIHLTGKYLNNYLNARLFLIDSKISDKFIELYENVKTLKELLSPLKYITVLENDEIIGTPINIISNSFYKINGISRLQAINNIDPNYKYYEINSIQIILTLFDLYRTLLYGINFKAMDPNTLLKYNIFKIFKNNCAIVVINNITKMLNNILQDSERTVSEYIDQLIKIKVLNDKKKSYINPLMEFSNEKINETTDLIYDNKTLPYCYNIESLSKDNKKLDISKMTTCLYSTLKIKLNNIIIDLKDNDKKYIIPIPNINKKEVEKEDIKQEITKQLTIDFNENKSKVKQYYLTSKYLSLKDLKNNVKYKVIIIDSESYNKEIDDPVICTLKLYNNGINKEIKYNNSNIVIDENIKRKISESFFNDQKLKIDAIVEF